MSIIQSLRTTYRRYIYWPWLDRVIYYFLDALTNIYASLAHFSFPENYIRRWKLNMLWELYEPETVALYKTIVASGMIVVDVGAHIGYFTRIFSKLVGEKGLVLAFEADEENLKILKENVAHLDNVKIFPLAVSEKNGVIDFYHCEEKAGCHSILENIPLNFHMTKRTVHSITLDEFVARQELPQVNVVKMDIEGGEWAALAGMKKVLSHPSTHALIVEFAPAWIKAAGATPLQFLERIASSHFDIFAITKEKLVRIHPSSSATYESLLPPRAADGSAYNQFSNLYCVKNATA